MNLPNGISVIGLRYDKKSSFLRGPALAPPLIREALFSESGNQYSEKGVDVLGSDLVTYEEDFIPLDYHDIRPTLYAIIRDDRRVVSIGGDHSITYPIIAAHYNAYGPINILHIDAHSDLYDDFEGDKHSHACPFARIMENKMAGRLVQVGIRCLTPPPKGTNQEIQRRDFGNERL